jgi:sec-independent protein translocase protein TatC
MKKNKAAAVEDDGSMSLSGHLRELRNRVAVCVVVLVLGFFGCLSIAGKLVTMLTDLGTAYQYNYVYIAPQELLLVYFNLALIGAVVITFPVLAYEAYAFCSPGLSRKERTSIALALLAGTLFFVIGVAFARFISVPFMLRFLIGFTTEVEVSASISIQEYVGFLMTVFLIFGAVFELPVISVLLTSLGVLRAEWLMKGRRVMIVLIFVLAAIITPPDIVSQIMVAVPMIGLYELSILLSSLVAKAKKEKADDDEDE